MMTDIRTWLRDQDFERFADLFEENEIDFDALSELKDDHLKELGIPLGPRVKLLRAIKALRASSAAKKRKKRINYDPYEEAMEDALRDYGALEKYESRRFARGITAYEQHVDRLNTELATNHGIEHVEEHRALICELLLIKNKRWWETLLEPGKISLEPDKWRIPKDAPSWTETRAQLTELAVKLRECDLALDKLTENPTFYAALSRIKQGDKFASSYLGFMQVDEIIAMAASIRGEMGNRPNPDWMQDFAKACRDFWREHMTSAAYPKFKDDGKKIPSNPFTKWAWDVMQKVGDFTLHQCGTELVRLRLKVPRTTPIKGT